MNKKTFKVVLFFFVILILSGLIFISSKIFKSNNDDRLVQLEKLAEIKKEKDLNYPYEFSIKDPGGKPIILKYTILSVRITSLIAAKGQPLESPKGKEFMVLSIELQNDSKYPLTVNSQDFIRLLGDDGKKYAADYYNGAIEVPAISVKKDELAFLITKDTAKIILSIGELDKDKTETEIIF